MVRKFTKYPSDYIGASEASDSDIVLTPKEFARRYLKSYSNNIQTIKDLMDYIDEYCNGAYWSFAFDEVDELVEGGAFDCTVLVEDANGEKRWFETEATE